MADSAFVDPAASAQQASPASAATPARAPTDKSFDPNAKVSTLQELKEQAPAVYKAMLEAIAQTVMSQMRKHDERMKDLYRGQR